MGISDGNGQMLGIEAENSGLGEPWPEKQLDAYVRLCAAICRQRKLGAEMVAGHREYALPKGRKIDPTGIDMPQFRQPSRPDSRRHCAGPGARRAVRPA
jgi:N-acetyl-anhydromuramyl-L-alanine amidase AmpD